MQTQADTRPHAPRLTITRTTDERETEVNIQPETHVRHAYILHLKGSDVIGREAKLNIICPLSDDALDTLDLTLYEPVACLHNQHTRDLFELTNNIESSWVKSLPAVNSKGPSHIVKESKQRAGGCRSTSVGDLVVIGAEAVGEEPQIWLCEGWGWTRYYTEGLMPAVDFKWHD